jgi:hypothetical protein
MSKTAIARCHIKAHGGTDHVIMQIGMDYILTEHTPRLLMV